MKYIRLAFVLSALFLFYSCDFKLKEPYDENTEAISDLEYEVDKLEGDLYIAYNALERIKKYSNNEDSVLSISDSTFSYLGRNRFKTEDEFVFDKMTFKSIILGDLFWDLKKIRLEVYNERINDYECK